MGFIDFYCLLTHAHFIFENVFTHFVCSLLLKVARFKGSPRDKNEIPAAEWFTFPGRSFLFQDNLQVSFLYYVFTDSSFCFNTVCMLVPCTRAVKKVSGLVVKK